MDKISIDPIQSVRDVFKHLSEGNLISAGQQYVESVPGVYLLGKAISNLAPKISPALGKPIAKVVNSAVKWYLQPFSSVVKQSVPTAKIIGAKALNPVLGIATAGALANHGASRLFKNTLSFADMIWLLGGGKPTQFQESYMNKKYNFKDYIFGNPFSAHLVKLIRRDL